MKGRAGGRAAARLFDLYRAPPSRCAAAASASTPVPCFVQPASQSLVTRSCCGVYEGAVRPACDPCCRSFPDSAAAPVAVPCRPPCCVACLSSAAWWTDWPPASSPGECRLRPPVDWKSTSAAVSLFANSASDAQRLTVNFKCSTSWHWQYVAEGLRCRQGVGRA